MKPAKYQRSTLMIIDKKEAKQFLNSGRGQYIVSQALFVAAKAMRDESPERVEHSNISDMDYLRENLFNAYNEELDQLIKGASKGASNGTN